MKDCTRSSLLVLVVVGVGCRRQVRQRAQRPGHAARGRQRAMVAGGRGAATARRPDSQPGGDREGLRQARDGGLHSISRTRARHWSARATPQEKIAGQRPAVERALAPAGDRGELSAAEVRTRTSCGCRTRLAGTENRIAVERRKYNETLQHYNTQIQLFPEQHRGVACRASRATTRISKPSPARGQAPKVAILRNDTQTFANYINGEWVKRRRRSKTATPPIPTKWSALFVKGTAAGYRDAADAAAAALPGMVGHERPGARQYLYKAADILDRKFDQVAADMTREEGKTLPEAKGEVRRVDQHLPLFRGRRLAHARHAGAVASATASTCSRSASRSAWWAWSRRGISRARFRRGSWRRR